MQFHVLRTRVVCFLHNNKTHDVKPNSNRRQIVYGKKKEKKQTLNTRIYVNVIGTFNHV